ncbi:MAG: hypothetical protein RIT43_1302, partial [Bacteroidota bacterium]
GVYTFGLTINNVGNKVAYSELATRDFIPINMKIGNSFKAKFDKYNHLTASFDIQRLLVPTPPYYDFYDSDYQMISGRNPDVGVIAGMVQSFYDAPGAPVTDEAGDYVQNADGSFQIVKNSRLKEELSEINFALGLEYWYNNVLAIRSGVFYENKNKGNRQYFNLGVGFKYNKFGVDMSYLASLNGRQSPLANTLRFTLRMTLGESLSESSDAKPE